MSLSTYPVVIIEDRYGGVYSGGKWLAVASAMTPGRLDVIEGGPMADDGTALSFWDNPPSWVAVGATPDQALAALRDRLVPYL